MANEKSLVTLTSIVNSFSSDVKEMISFNLENLRIPSMIVNHSLVFVYRNFGTYK